MSLRALEPELDAALSRLDQGHLLGVVKRACLESEAVATRFVARLLVLQDKVVVAPSEDEEGDEEETDESAEESSNSSESERESTPQPIKK